MTRNATQNPPRRRRSWTLRIVGLLAVIAALGFGWNYAWHHGARLLDQEVAAFLSNSNDAGREIECANRRVEGFPFRVGIFCDAVSAYAVRDGVRIRTGALRSAAQFYAPGRIVGEMDGPLTASTSAGGSYTAGWASLRASARVGLDGVKRISFQTRDLDLAARPPDNTADNTTGYTAKLKGGELHLRPTPARDDAVDLAFLLDALEISPAARRPLPAFALSGDVRLDGMREELRPGFNLLDHLRANGIAGEIRRAELAPLAGGSVTLAGTFRVSRGGLLSARLAISSADASGIAGFLARAFPTEDDLWQQLNQAFVLLAAVDTSGSKQRTLTIEIESGVLLLGPIPVAEIPPLF